MPTAYITKSVKLESTDYARIEEAMKRTGVLNFTEFVRRALDTEVRMSQLREKHIYDLLEQEAAAAEDPAPYKAKPKDEKTA